MKFQEHSLLSLTFHPRLGPASFPRVTTQQFWKVFLHLPQSLSPLLNIRARIKYSFTYKFCIQKQTVRLVLFMTFILPRRTSTREKKKATFYARNRFLFTRRNSFATRDSPSFFIHASV